MERFEWSDHIVFNPQILVGKATIRGTRISALSIVEMLAAGVNEAQILEAYPHLSSDGIRACMGYAVHLMRKEIDIGRPSRAFPVTPPCVRIRTRRFGFGSTIHFAFNSGTPSVLK